MKKIDKKNKIVKNLKLKESLDRFVTYYTGETINGIPYGKGTSETYDYVKGIDEKVHKIKGKKWVNNYQKSFLKKLKYHNIESKYVGEWKNGMENGIGELIVYHGPDYFINYDGSPKVFSKSITQGVHELNVKDLKSGVYYLRAGAEVLPVIVP